MKLSTAPYKGTKDYYPEEMRVRNWIFDTWRQVCRQYGYEEYDSPILEPLELYASKTSDEIVNEQTYAFTDRGKRQVAMRPEMTPSVSRMVAAKRQELAYPLRMFSIPNCFRYERPQRGRTREFWQLNADIFGVEGTSADIEIIMLADAIMKAFGANEKQYEIQINSRQVVDDVFSEMKLDQQQRTAAMSLIDKKEKVKAEDWEQMFVVLLGKDQALKLLQFLQDESVPQNAQDLIDRLNKQGVNNVVFNRYLARGFEYYTDIVFEVFDKNPENNRSMFGGGRYSGLVGKFGVEPLEAAGMAMGDATLMNFLESNKLLPSIATETDVYVVVVGEALDGAQQVASELRSKGLNVAVDLSGRKLDKQIKTADKKGIRYALFVGEAELEKNEYKLKNLETGAESTLSSQKIVEAIQ